MPKKAPKKKSTSKVVVEETVAPVAPVVTDATVDPPPADDTVAELQLFDYSDEISSLKTDLKTALDLVRSIMTNVTALEKRSARDTKVVAKKMRGKVRRTGDNKIISGFSKPGPVSEELRTFLKIGKDDLIARTQVTKAITKYCQEHDLQNKKDRRIIMADKTLQKLLRVTKNDELTYFNLQKYMKVHFPNKEGVYPTL